MTVAGGIVAVIGLLVCGYGALAYGRIGSGKVSPHNAKQMKEIARRVTLVGLGLLVVGALLIAAGAFSVFET